MEIPSAAILFSQHAAGDGCNPIEPVPSANRHKSVARQATKTSPCRCAPPAHCGKQPVQPRATLTPWQAPLSIATLVHAIFFFKKDTPWNWHLQPGPPRALLSLRSHPTCTGSHLHRQAKRSSRFVNRERGMGSKITKRNANAIKI